MTAAQRTTEPVLQATIDVLDWPSAMDTVFGWAAQRESRYVCFCNAHSVVTAGTDAAFRAAIAQADMAAPDGTPVAWMLRRLGHARQQRISGPDMMLRCCERAAASGMPIALFGSTPQTLDQLKAELRGRWPGLQVAVALSPPFRALSPAEDESFVQALNTSGAGLVFVSLGCPKQELWMHAHRSRVQAVMLGVGAAFDFHAGTVARAPQWMQRRGLEWLHRLLSEPRRLWRRYFVTNSLFIIGAARQLLLARRR